MAQTRFAFEDITAPAPTQAARAHRVGAELHAASPGLVEDTGFALGLDHARYGRLPPPEHLLPSNPLRQGWEAGRSRFAGRTPTPTQGVDAWLALRLQAWMHGRTFEDIQVTPHYLAQLDSGRCPVTRELLTRGTGKDTDATLERVFHDAGYAAGNLVVLGRRARAAQGSLRWDEARDRGLAAGGRSPCAAGLSSAEWARLASLLSFVTPLPHAVAAALPLRLLPPNRLRLLNPIQGLQALITLQLTEAGFAERCRRLCELLADLPAGRALQRDFHLLIHSLLPRAWDGGRPLGPVQWRERLEDAWADEVVLRRWQRFAGGLDGPRAEALVRQAAAAGLGGRATRVEVHAAEQATEGWALDSAGLLPTAGVRRTSPSRPARAAANGAAC